MSDKFTRQESRQLTEYLDLAEGEQTNAHHCKQGKGNDKLYIKKVENNAYILYCHHCGKSGYVPGHESTAKFLQDDIRKIHEVSGSNRDSDSPVSIRIGNGDRETDRRATGEASSGFQFNLPRDASRNIAGWSSVQAKLWILSNGIKVSTLKDYEIYWSDYLSAIIFPQRQKGELVGYQYRKFPNPEGHPKYKTVTKPGFIRKNEFLDGVYPLGVCESTNSCMLVEDYISAIRIGSLGYPTFPLWGSNLGDRQLAYMLQYYSKFGIMLDNDNQQIKKMQRGIAERLRMHGKEVQIFYLDKDPKEYKDFELIEILKEF